MTRLIRDSHHHPANPHTENVTVEGSAEPPFQLRMSTASESGPSVECHYPGCDEYGPVWEYHHGKYCSTACETRHDGRQALAGLYYDHAVCATCFRDLKTFIDPKDDDAFIECGSGWTRDADGRVTLEVYRQDETRKAAIGCEFLTPDATKGEKHPRNSNRVITGTICNSCGNTDHTHHDTILSTTGAIERLIDRLQADDDVTLNPVQLCIVYSATQDLDLAVGRALVE